MRSGSKPGVLPSDVDQAASLRRLFADRPTQVIAFAGGTGKCGRTTLVTHAAASLARTRRKVILVDENDSPTNALGVFGAPAEPDLFDAAFGATPLSSAVWKVAPNLWVASAAKAAALLRVDTPKAQEIAKTLMAPLTSAAKFVLIDSLVLEGDRLSLLSAQAHHMIVVVSAQADAITHAYALIKHLAAERGRAGFHLALTMAKSDKEATTIFNNVKATAKRYLGVRVDYLGSFGLPLPADITDILLARLPLAGTGSKL